MVKHAAKFIIQGTVQGVFYRKFVKENADKLNLRGHVRNTEDGNVEVIVEGEKENILQFPPILKQGPAHAQIQNIITEEKKWSGDFQDFKILRF